MDVSIVVVCIVSPYQHITVHKNKICPGRHCTILSVDFLMNTANQVSNKQYNALFPHSVDKQDSHTEFWARGCWGSCNFRAEILSLGCIFNALVGHDLEKSDLWGIIECIIAFWDVRAPTPSLAGVLKDAELVILVPSCSNRQNKFSSKDVKFIFWCPLRRFSQ